MLASLDSVKKAWKATATQRGYHFGFNLKGLRPTVASLKGWFEEAKANRVGDRSGLTVSVYVTPLHAIPVDSTLAAEFEGQLGIQEVHWGKAGSHTGATPVGSVLTDTNRVNAVLIHHSEVIAEHGRTLEQAAAQLRMVLDTAVESRAFRFITLCVGEDRAVYDQGTEAAQQFVASQVKTILTAARVTEAEMSRIGVAYEPRFAIQVGDIPGIPPTDAHIQAIGWAILQAAADAVSIEGMASMFALQYGGSMKGPEDKVAAVQRFVGPGNQVEENLYNGGLIGTAGKDPLVAAAIIGKIVA